MRGSLTLGFAADAARGTILAHLAQSSPCRAFFPTPEPSEPLGAVLVNTSGGLVGGDHIALAISAPAGTQALVTTQAAEKVYRSTGADCVLRTRLHLGCRARLEWLPQETILFEGARLDRRIDIHLAQDARLFAAETVLFGRQARGERLTRGLLLDHWRLHVDGRLAWADAIRLDGDIAAARDRPWGFGAAAGYATLLVAGADAGEFLGAARAHLAASPPPPEAQAGATLVNGVLLLRFMAPDGKILCEMLSRAILALRPAVMDRPAALPRSWSI